MTSSPDDRPAEDRPDAGSDQPFASAEAWLAARGVTRDPIRVTAPERPADAPPPPGPPPSAREARRLAEEAPPPAEPTQPETPDAIRLGNLEDEVAKALAFVRRSTAAQPAAEGRLRRKLAERDTPRVVVDQAIRRARDERLVDDGALVRALVDERRAKGHALPRIRQDLRKRELPDDLIEAELARHEHEDPEALAFDVARRKAASYGALDPEKAFRRLVGYLARRGHNEGLARKVARQVVWADREDDTVAGH